MQGAPIKKAKVYKNGEKIEGTVSDGMYQLKVKPGDKFTLSAKAEGFEFGDFSVSLKENDGILPTLYPTKCAILTSQGKCSF